MALTDNLVAAWELNETGSGANAVDSHGSETLTANASGFPIGNDTGKVYATARELVPGDGNYFSRADDAPLSLGSDTAFEFELWVNFNSVAGTQILLNKGNVTGNGDEYLLWLSSGKIELYVGNGGASANIAEASATISTGTWNHIFCRHDPDANQIAIIVNGTERTASWSGGTQDTSNNFAMGGASDGSSRAAVIIGPVRFWKGRILTSGERTQLDNSGNGLPYSEFGGGGTFALRATVLGWN